MVSNKCASCLNEFTSRDRLLACSSCDKAYHHFCLSSGALTGSSVRHCCRPKPETLISDSTVVIENTNASVEKHSSSHTTTNINKKRQASSPNLRPEREVKQRCSSLSELPSQSSFPSNPKTCLSENMPTLPGAEPDWFTSFKEVYTQNTAENKQSFGNIQGTLNSLHTDFNIKRHEDYLRDKLSILTDTCELLVIGLPIEFTKSKPLYEAARHVLSAIGFGIGHDLPTIVDTRQWNTASNANSSHTTPISSSRSPNQRLQTTGFVFQVSSPLLRDKILSKSRFLNGKNAATVFGVGGNTPIYIRALWPKPIHDLFVAAIKSSKSLNYARPLVKNMRVCMRKTVRSELVPILSVEQLSDFTPAQETNHSMDGSASQEGATS